jgi:hypothetical protein
MTGKASLHPEKVGWNELTNDRLIGETQIY